MSAKYDIFDIFSHFVELFLVLQLVEAEKLWPALPLFHDQLLLQFLVLRTSVQLL